jgi:Ubiquitin family
MSDNAAVASALNVKSKRVYVQTLTGQRMKYRVEWTDTVGSLKKQIAERTGVAFERLNLVYKGAVLSDCAETLAFYKLEYEGTIHLIVHMRSSSD